jgi:hypothetical protein
LELAFIELLPDEPAPAVASTTAPAAVEASPPPAKPVTSAKPATTTETAEPESESISSAEESARAAAVAETAAQEAPAKPAADPATPSLSLKEVSAHWQEMVVDVGEHNKNLPPLLNMGKPLAVEGNVIVLGFDYTIFRDKFDNMPDASRMMAEAYTELLGVRCSVRSVVTSDYTVPVDREEFRALADELGGVVRENE